MFDLVAAKIIKIKLYDKNMFENIMECANVVLNV